MAAAAAAGTPSNRAASAALRQDRRVSQMIDLFQETLTRIQDAGNASSRRATADLSLLQQESFRSTAGACMFMC